MRIVYKYLSLLAIASISLSVNAQNVPAEFSAIGDWHFSSLPGDKPDKQSLWTVDHNASATWTPEIRSVGPVRIYFYVVSSKGNAENAEITVVHDGTQDRRILNMQSKMSQWVELGTFTFSGSGMEYVEVRHGNSTGAVRVAGVRFEILQQHNLTKSWQTIVDDDVAPVNQALRRATVKTFLDLSGSPVSQEAGILAAEGVLPGFPDNTFRPNDKITASEMVHAFAQWSSSDELHLHSSLLTTLATKNELTSSELVSILVQAALSSGKNLEWAKCSSNNTFDRAKSLRLLDSNSNLLLNQKPPLTRIQAVGLLWRFQQSIVTAGPPIEGHWKLAFSDDFDGTSLSSAVWSSEQGATRTLSTRWPENAVVSEGLLHLVTRKEKRGKADWTSAAIWTKNFHQAYGYWEARYRYANASGLNQAFWINPRDFAHQAYEIDINEGHYPNEVNATLHQRNIADNSTRYLSPFDLSADFHIYACEWDNSLIIYYVDGKEIARKPNTEAHLPAPVLFSTALTSWAGKCPIC